MRIECTGFGLNLVSGNFEFASLIVIDAEDFWSRYGGQVEANWESWLAASVLQPRQRVARRTGPDPAWSNEGLFALMQGLRRLKQIDGSRVNIPAIEWQIL